MCAILLRLDQASRSVLDAAKNAVNSIVNGGGGLTRSEFLAARRGGRKWHVWELEALQSAVQAFRYEGEELRSVYIRKDTCMPSVLFVLIFQEASSSISVCMYMCGLL